MNRVRSGSRRRWQRWVLTPRTAVAVTLALACVVGANLARVNVVREAAIVAGGFAESLSSDSNEAPAAAVYCSPGLGPACTTAPPPAAVKSVSAKKPKKAKKKKKKKHEKKHKKRKHVSPAFTG